MKTLINLIGEQPIPNLLPVLFLKPDKTILLHTNKTKIIAERIQKLVENSELKPIDPYDITKGIETIHSLLNDNDKFIFNLTGGTKIMVLAAYHVSNQIKGSSVYLESENRKNLLYIFSDSNSQSPNVEVIPELINIDHYLRAHLPDYTTEGFHIDPKTREISKGGKFEESICKALEGNSFETLVGIRPKGVGNQIEIDLAIRLKGTNNVGIAEIKMGDKEEEGPKKGLDQLAMAAERDYLGTYTTRFLITARFLSSKIKELARTHHINVIDGLEYDFNREVLSEKSKTELINKIKEKLS